MEHGCRQEERLTQIEKDLIRAEAKLDNVENDIREIKETLRDNMIWIRGVLVTCIMTLAAVLLQYLGQ